MNYITCDICNQIIKPKDIRHYIATIDMDDEADRTEVREDMQDAMALIKDMAKKYNNNYDNTKVKEICETCKGIYDYLFRLRKDEVDILNGEVKRILNFKVKPSKSGDSKNDKKNK